MREYGKIKTSFWGNAKVRSVSEPARLLLAYIFSCPHGNSAGCFVLPFGYVSEDLGWPIETVRERFTELLAKGFVEHDEATKLVRVPSWWEHNSVENPNVARALVKTVRALPKCPLLSKAIEQLQAPEWGFPESVSKLFVDAFRQPVRNMEPEPEPEPKPEPIPIAGAIGAASPLAVPTPLDLKRELWTRGKAFLAKHSIDAKHAGSLLGDWRKDHGDLAVMDALAKAEAECASDVVSFIVGCLKRSKNGGSGRNQPNGADGTDRLRAGLARAVAARLGPGERDTAADDNAAG